MQRPQTHQGDRRGAIRIGQNPLVPSRRLRIDLGHHERNIRIHAERRRVVDHHRTRFDRSRRKFFRNGPARAEQREVDTRESIRRQFAHLDRRTLEIELLAGRLGRSEQGQLAHRKFSALQHAHHFDAHRAGCTRDRYMIVPAHRKAVENTIQAPPCE